MDPSTAFRILVESLHCIDLAAIDKVDDSEHRNNAWKSCRSIADALKNNKTGFDVEENIVDLTIVSMNRVRP